MGHLTSKCFFPAAILISQDTVDCFGLVWLAYSCSIMLYLLASGSDPAETADQLTRDLNRISNWAHICGKLHSMLENLKI